MQEVREIGIGLLGYGTVGQAVNQILQTHQESLTRRLGAKLVLQKVAVRDPAKLRASHPIDAALLTASVDEVLQHPRVDIVVELMGGVDQARYALMEALQRDKQVVTANKALIASHGQELFDLAQKKQRDLLFEAAVAGGIPILRSLREAFVGNRVKTLLGIVNGTCNTILSAMAQALNQPEPKGDFQDFLKEAVQKGYAEADPTLDIDGTDAVQKLAILASLAFGHWVDFRRIYKEGISQLRMVDFALARDFGYRIKLLAIAKDTEDGLDVRVHPVLLHEEHLLATIDDVYNAIWVEGDPSGPLLFFGRGAGGGPTATAVVADIIDAARNLLASALARVPVLSYAAQPAGKLQLADLKKLLCRYYLRLMVVDRPGALAAITHLLGKHHISIASVVQKERSKQAPVPVVLLTHQAKEKDMRAALQEIDQLEVIVDRSLSIRIEE